MSDVKKVVLAYSGGLDTSVILKWLQQTYGCEVVTFTADLGQGEELEPARKKAEMLGIKEIYIEDLREDFVRDYVFPMFRANAVYEGVYLLGTSIARPLDRQAPDRDRPRDRGRCGLPRRHRQGQRPGALRAQLLCPQSGHQGDRPLARMGPDLAHAADRLRRAAPDPHPKDKRGEAPFSVDANLLHISAEGKEMEDPWIAPGEHVFSRSVSPEAAPDQPTVIEIDLREGRCRRHRRQGPEPRRPAHRAEPPGRRQRHRPPRSGGEPLRRHEKPRHLRDPRRHHLLAAHRAMESITLDRGAAHLKDELMPRYAELIYNGFWFSPEREMLQALDRQEPGAGQRHGAPQALQGQRHRRGPEIAAVPLLPGARHLRGGFGLRPARRPGLHQAERLASAPAEPAKRLTRRVTWRGASLGVLGPDGIDIEALAFGIALHQGGDAAKGLGV